jgi:hypothetical protein
MSPAKAGGVRIQVRTAAAVEDFRQVRRELDPLIKEGLRVAGERIVLPGAKVLAGNLKVTDGGGNQTLTASTLTVKARARDAILTSTLTGPLNRAVGLQEFGGDVSTPIYPVVKDALVVNGQPVASVTTTRHYEGHGFLTGAVDAELDAFADALLEHEMRAFDGFERG